MNLIGSVRRCITCGGIEHCYANGKGPVLTVEEISGGRCGIWFPIGCLRVKGETAL